MTNRLRCVWRYLKAMPGGSVSLLSWIKSQCVSFSNKLLPAMLTPPDIFAMLKPRWQEFLSCNTVDEMEEFLNRYQIGQVAAVEGVHQNLVEIGEELFQGGEIETAIVAWANAAALQREAGAIGLSIFARPEKG